MIIVDGQEIIENKEDKLGYSQEIQKDRKSKKKIGIVKCVGQFLMKLFEIFCEMLLICFIYLVLKGYYKTYKYGGNGSYIYYEDVIFSILFIAVCFFMLYINLSSLFKYENNYKLFGRFKKLYRKIQGFDDKITDSKQNEKKLKTGEISDKENDEMEVRLVNSIYPLVSNLFSLFDSNSKSKSSSQLAKNIFFPKIRRRRHSGIDISENTGKLITNISIIAMLIFLLVFIGFLFYISKKK